MVMRLSIFVGLLTCFTPARGVLLAQTTAAELPTREALEHFELNVRPAAGEHLRQVPRQPKGERWSAR